MLEKYYPITPVNAYCKNALRARFLGGKALKNERQKIEIFVRIFLTILVSFVFYK